MKPSMEVFSTEGEMGNKKQPEESKEYLRTSCCMSEGKSSAHAFRRTGAVERRNDEACNDDSRKRMCTHCNAWDAIAEAAWPS